MRPHHAAFKRGARVAETHVTVFETVDAISTQPLLLSPAVARPPVGWMSTNANTAATTTTTTTLSLH